MTTGELRRQTTSRRKSVEADITEGSDELAKLQEKIESAKAGAEEAESWLKEIEAEEALLAACERSEAIRQIATHSCARSSGHAKLDGSGRAQAEKERSHRCWRRP